jgi:UDP-N-acetylglucosamine 2-epimerase (non-hydrolysing)
MSPVIRECQRRGVDYFILHSGQHYSYELDGVFFTELGLPEPKYNLDIGSSSHAEETAKILIGAERIMVDEKPDVVLVEGDTNTVFATALAATKLGIKVGHVEAGLRSRDRSMPEEINRCLTDHISDYLFAPTEESRHNLLAEGIDDSKIFVTGNTIVDALYQGLDVVNSKPDALSKLNPKKGEYFIVTAHRQENVDIKPKLKGILDGLKLIYDGFNLPIVFPIHPRTRKRLDDFGLEIPDGIELITPQGFLGFLKLEEGARLILTDSGGVQEEACILRVPCVTLRENTERPETIAIGANILAGTSPDRMAECVEIMLSRENGWQNPFGDGKAGKRIVEVIG